MTPAIETLPLIDDELDFLAGLAPLAGREIIELGCGAAALARSLLSRYPDSRVTGLEVDARQHAKNIAAPHPALTFIAAGAEAIPFPAASFDLAMMLKSLHHVPLPLLDTALAEVARVLKPGGLLYVSEPVFAGDFNEVVRLFNDEEVVRAEAQAALRRAESLPQWQAAGEIPFETPRRFADFDDFARKTIAVTFAERHLDEAMLAEVRRRFELHLSAEGALFMQPMRVSLLRRTAV